MAGNVGSLILLYYSFEPQFAMVVIWMEVESIYQLIKLHVAVSLAQTHTRIDVWRTGSVLES